MFHIDFDARSYAQIDQFMDFGSIWEEHMIQQYSHHLARISEEHMKPLMVKRDYSTGKLQESLKSLPETTGTGFKIEFESLFYGLYQDRAEGNFSPNMVLWAQAYGMDEFHIDARLGKNIRSPYIHGMGSYTEGTPTRFSEATSRWLLEAELDASGLRYMQAFLDGVIL